MQYFGIKQFILKVLIFTFYFRKTGKPLLFILITLSLKRSRKEGLNLRHLVLETNVLPTELFSYLKHDRYSVEARNRLFLLLFNGLSTITIACLYKENLLFSLTYQSILKLKSQPAEILYFIFTNVTEMISVYISGAFFLSYQILFIYFIYQIFIFLSPAFFNTEYSR